MGGIASLVGLPPAIAGLVVGSTVSKGPEMPGRRIALLTFAGFALVAYGYDVYDRLFADHRYRYQFAADGPRGDQGQGVPKRKRHDRREALHPPQVEQRHDRLRRNQEFEFVESMPIGQNVLKSNNPSIQYMIFFMRANKVIGNEIAIFDTEAVTR